MFHFLCKTIPLKKICYFSTAEDPSIGLLSYAFVRYLSSDANQHSFTISYLINKYGFSPESALSISKRVNFENPAKPDLVLSFFKNLGFSKSQISKMISWCPRTISANADKIIFPKVEFFLSKGASTADLIRIFASFPWLLERSLENQLVPSFKFFRNLHQSDEQTIATIKRFPSILARPLEAAVIPNINTLRANGVPLSNMLLLVRYHPQKIGMEAGRFKKIVEVVKEMGFDPCKSQFVLAIMALTGTTKSMWDRKVDAYKSWGWSNEDIYRAFGKYPWCMTISEDKIMAVMDFYVNKLGLESSVIVNRPLLLSFSLKKRLVPRASVIQFLSSKGLMKMDPGMTKAFECTEKYFMDKYINCNEEALHLLKLYGENLELSKQVGDQQPGTRKPKWPFRYKSVSSS